MDATNQGMIPPPAIAIPGAIRAPLDKYVKDFALQHGYAIVIGRSRGARLECKYRCHLSGDPPKTPTADPDPTDPEKCNCPFELFSAYDETAGEWRMIHINTTHNHAPTPPSAPKKVSRKKMLAAARKEMLAAAQPALFTAPGPVFDPALAAGPALAAVHAPAVAALAALAAVAAPAAIIETAPAPAVVTPRIEADRPAYPAPQANQSNPSALSTSVYARATQIEALPAQAQQDILQDIDRLLRLYSSTPSQSPRQVRHLSSIPSAFLHPDD